MLSDLSGGFIAGLLTILPSQVVALVVVALVVGFMILAMNKGKRENNEADDKRQGLRNEWSANHFATVQAELKRMVARCDACDAELATVEERLRAEQWTNHTLRIERDNLIISRDSLRHVITSLCEQAGKVPPVWPAPSAVQP